MSTTEVDMNGSPTDRSKRPRLEDGDLDSDYERDGQDDRHPKRQAVPDPETKAPHFAGASDLDSDNKNESNGTSSTGQQQNNSDNNNTPTGRSRRKKWEEGGSQDSDDGDDDEVQILLDAGNTNEEGKGTSSTSTGAAASSTTNGADMNDSTVAANANAASAASGIPFDAAASDAQSLASLPPGVPTVNIRSLVSTKDAGVIIGRGGKNVSEIREMSAARVTISDIIPGAYERILTVSGPVNSVAKAYSLVAQKILSEMPNADNGQEQSLTIRLLVADTRMGTLIGRGGSVIRSIQEHSHARVNASEEPLPMSTERTVTIVGTTDAVQSAIQQISEILAEHPERVNTNSTVQYRPQPQGSTSGNMSNRGYHSGMGRVSSSGVNGAAGANAVAAAASSMNPYGAMMGHMGGMPMSGANPQFYYQAAAAAAAAGAYGGMPSTSGRQGDYGMAGMVASSQAQQIFIPNEMVGCIIGKGGSKINEIRQLSGSHIKIADPHGNTNERLVTITGTPESNQMALYLLYSRLESEKGRLGLR
ncbi:hypothetical protein BDA99DRAFT_540716 [Phascolomyces articulosus]|uniref:K Homology domain-containing protein n=1 Tax=Phascolomyces articulosus TaxID=60185 RepID=A0AAD5PAW9_9FUNG|nr:hypothetical protein BDA99DRAFT_540716 [Phascolomyces articulosus]